jgi:hypothetical protein
MGETMNWLILISNTTFGLIATLLCVLGLNTLKTIKYLNTGKSFWIPVIASGLLFSISSIITIFNEMGLSLTFANEIGQITQLIALCFLSGGIYGYSRTIRKNLSDKYIIPEAPPTQNDKIEANVSAAPSIDKEAIGSNTLRLEPASRCNHQLGYLRTLPVNASLPEECLRCDKIITCRHS